MVLSISETEKTQRSGSFDAPSGLSFKCLGCGGPLRYSITDKKMRCGQCESLYEVSSFNDPTKPAKGEKAAEIDTVEYRCPSCGASLHATETGTTSFCSFCGSDVVLTQRVSSIRRPDRIIPFTVSRRECEKIYRNRLRESPLVPDEMKSMETIGHFRPVYVPFWCFSGSGSGDYIVHYTTDSVRDDSIISDTFKDVRNGSVSVSGICYDASSQFDDDTAQWLQFSTGKSIPFHPAYLSGFYAEAPDADSKYFTGLARDYASRCVTASNMSLPENFEENAELILMPVWLLVSRQGEKIINTAIRGCGAGRIRCDLPVSPKRFMLMTGIIAVLITALVLLLNHYIILRPQITAALSCLLAAVCWNIAGPFMQKMHLQREENDPTRKILRNGGSARDIIRYLNHSNSEDARASGAAIPMKKIGMYALAAVGILLVIYLFTRNKLRFSNALISDTSILPTIIAGFSGFLLFMIWDYCPDLGSFDRIAWKVQFVICCLIVLLKILPFPVSKLFYYIMGIISFITTLLILLNAFRLHNLYIVRPAPFFGGEEGSK